MSSIAALDRSNSAVVCAQGIHNHRHSPVKPGNERMQARRCGLVVGYVGMCVWMVQVGSEAMYCALIPFR